MSIRLAVLADMKDWLNLRNNLWPDSATTNSKDIDDYFSKGSYVIKACYLAEEQSKIIGFIELNIRSYAEGSHSARVPFVEGWYVDEEYRNKGFGKQLMKQAEEWALSKGFSELASDAEIDNTNSISAHKHLGFAETDRIVCFLKKLKLRA